MKRAIEVLRWTAFIIGFIPLVAWAAFEFYRTRNDDRWQTDPEME